MRRRCSHRRRYRAPPGRPPTNPWACAVLVVTGIPWDGGSCRAREHLLSRWTCRNAYSSGSAWKKPRSRKASAGTCGRGARGLTSQSLSAGCLHHRLDLQHHQPTSDLDGLRLRRRPTALDHIRTSTSASTWRCLDPHPSCTGSHRPQGSTPTKTTCFDQSHTGDGRQRRTAAPWGTFLASLIPSRPSSASRMPPTFRFWKWDRRPAGPEGDLPSRTSYPCLFVAPCRTMRGTPTLAYLVEGHLSPEGAWHLAAGGRRAGPRAR